MVKRQIDLLNGDAPDCARKKLVFFKNEAHSQ
jgi:hypothetical protein